MPNLVPHETLAFDITTDEFDLAGRYSSGEFVGSYVVSRATRVRDDKLVGLAGLELQRVWRQFEAIGRRAETENHFDWLPFDRDRGLRTDWHRQQDAQRGARNCQQFEHGIASCN